MTKIFSRKCFKKCEMYFVHQFSRSHGKRAVPIETRTERMTFFDTTLRGEPRFAAVSVALGRSSTTATTWTAWNVVAATWNVVAATWNAAWATWKTTARLQPVEAIRTSGRATWRRPAPARPRPRRRSPTRLADRERRAESCTVGPWGIDRD